MSLLKIIFLLFLSLQVQVFATETTATSVHYELHNLRPKSISQYDAADPGILRQYLHFENEQGNHTFIYDELGSVTPMREILNLRQIIGSWDSVCSVDLDCTAKAFCTGDCKNMYYELTNAPANPAASEKNRCQIHYLSCEKSNSNNLIGTK